MLSSHIYLGILGLASGLAVSAGTFAFIVAMSVVPRMIGKWKQASRTIHFESAIVAGGIFGNIISVFPDIRLHLGVPFLCLYGLSSGIFVGCLAVALAEIINTFPIMFRRIGLKRGLACSMIAMAVGKTVGALYFFWYQMSI